MKKRKHYRKRMGYKVVRRSEDGTLWSALKPELDGIGARFTGGKRFDLGVRYKVGKVTIPKRVASGTYLFAFLNLWDARRYASYSKGEYVVYRCTCYTCYEDSAVRDVLSLEEIRRFFRNPDCPSLEFSVTTQYGTTLLSKGIKITNKIPVA